MIAYLSFFLLLRILVIFSNHINPIHCQSNNNDNNNNQVSGRVLPGCALTGNKIYCFGGFTGSSLNNGVGYQNATNDHIELDLTAFGNFNVLDQSKIQWVNKSNTVDGVPLGAIGQLGTAVLSDGSYVVYGGKNSPYNTQPFAVYHPQSDQWNGIPMYNNTYYIRTQIVNLGNDQIWIWGGDVPTIFPNLTVDMFYIYDFKNGQWPIAQIFTKNVSIDHTATLVNNIIYIIGGSSINAKTTGKTINNFSEFKTYHTIDGIWGNITTNGTKPTDRAYHTTVATEDNKYLLIYGGNRPLNNKFQVCDDVYYIYDIEKNNLQGVDITNPPGSYTYKRFGHFAAIYKLNYLLLVFGYNDLNTPTTDNLNVLNIQNPFQPNWVQLTTNTDNPNNPSQPIHEENKEIDKKTIVPAVVVPVVVVLSGAAVALFFFNRHRKRKQKKQFILEKEDPRKLYNRENDLNQSDLFSKGTLVVRSDPSEGRNSLTVYQYHHDEGSSKISDRLHSVKPSELKDDTMTSSEHKDTIKSSEHKEDAIKTSEHKEDSIKTFEHKDRIKPSELS